MKKPFVELAMIVRNGSTSLARAIRSALPAVDRVIVGDTGSTDDSVAIARSLGAHVFDVPWEDDFSKARNAVLQACAGDWVLILDADEMLDPVGASKLPLLAMQTQVDAWEVWRWSYIRTLTSRNGLEPARTNPKLLRESRPYPAYTRNLNTLFFRRRPGLYFENEVHETVSKRVQASGLASAVAPFVIHHFGFAEDSLPRRRQKLERYHQMGLHKVQMSPLDYWAHYELGLSYLEHRHDPQMALSSFDEAIKLNPRCRGAWIYGGMCLTRLGRLEQALGYLNHAEEEQRPNALLLEAKGDVFFYSGDYAPAASQYRRCGDAPDRSPLVECKLGACEVAQGQSAEGLARIQAAAEREPHAAELYDIWVAAALLGGDATTAAQVAEQRLAIGEPAVDAFVIAAGLQARLGRWDFAASILQQGLRRHPGAIKLEREWKVARDRVCAAEMNSSIAHGEPRP